MPTIIDRAEVPAGSFRYGQAASNPGFDVPADLWAVCTGRCFREDGSEVIVAHFLMLDEADALDCAANLDGTYEVWVVRPKVQS